MANQNFDLKMKLHYEQKKSEACVRAIEKLQKTCRQKDAENEELRREKAELEARIQFLQEELDKQALVVEDAQLVNESYQKRFVELHARLEQYHEEVTPRYIKQVIAKLDSIEDMPSATGLRMKVTHTRSDSEFYSTPIRCHNITPSQESAPFTPPDINSEEESEEESQHSSGRSYPCLSPALPSEEDLTSLYGQNDSESELPQLPIGQQLPSRTLHEIKQQMEARASYFEDAKKRLDGFAEVAEEALSPVRRIGEEQHQSSRHFHIRMGSRRHSDFYEQGSQSECSFEIVKASNSKASANAKGKDIEAVSPATAVQASDPRTSLLPTPPPSSPVSDIWIDQARTSSSKSTSRHRRLQTRYSRSYANGTPEVHEDANVISEFREEADGNSEFYEEADGTSEVHEGANGTPEVHEARYSKALRRVSGLPIPRMGVGALLISMQQQRCEAASEHDKESEASFSGVERAGSFPSKIAAGFASGVARSAKKLGLSGTKKPKVPMSRTTSSASLVRRSVGDRRLVPPPTLPFPVLAERTSWESLKDMIDEKGFLRTTIAAKNKIKKTNKGWGTGRGQGRE